MGVSFHRAATQILQSLWNAPKPLIMVTVQAGKGVVAAERILWGCAVKNFRANLPFGPELKAEGPFHGMRQDFAAL